MIALVEYQVKIDIDWLRCIEGFIDMDGRGKALMAIYNSRLKVIFDPLLNQTDIAIVNCI